MFSDLPQNEEIVDLSLNLHCIVNGHEKDLSQSLGNGHEKDLSQSIVNGHEEDLSQSLGVMVMRKTWARA